MRHIITTLVWLMVCMTAINTNAQSGLRPRGDVNCDWEVNIADVNAVIDSIFSGANYHSFYSYATDVNGDKEINIADVNMVLDALLGGNLPPMPSYSGTLPVLFINTEGFRDIVSKETYLHAKWWLDNMGNEGYESIGSPSEPLGMQIKGRGNSTWANLDKKPFRLKLDVKHNVLGMPSNRHWILMANAQYWMGQMNDALPFEIGRRMGMAWNPRQEPIEVVLNGEYIGLYFLTEKVRIDKDRVDIIEQQDFETDPDRITGGWLLEIENFGQYSNIEFTEGNGIPFFVTTHSPEQLSDEQKDFITSFLMRTDSAIYLEDKNNSLWEQYIDIDALAIYYIVQETVDNHEAFSGSCFMHKQRGNDTKLIFGPLWDCGSSFSRWSPSYEFNEFIYENLPSYFYSRWIGEIVKFPRFQERIKYHWKRFYEEVYPAMDDYLDSFAAKIEQAGNADKERWPQYWGDDITRRLNIYGKPSFHKKVAWLNEQWGETGDNLKTANR